MYIYLLLYLLFVLKVLIAAKSASKEKTQVCVALIKAWLDVLN